jgi:predicted LPLAT superfamily acyltransferase
MREMNPDSTVSVIQVTEVGPETAMMLAEKVSKGEFIVIVGDRTPVEKSTRITWAPFLGKLAPFPQGPFILAALLKCPVQMIFCIKRAGHYHVLFEPLAEAIEMPRGNRNMVLGHWITRYAERLENYCLQDPYQWFNFFDFWGQAGTVAPDGAEQKT